MSGKGVNTRTDNLRVHTAGSDTCTTSVGTTTRLGWLERRSHGCPKVMGTTSMIYISYLKPSFDFKIVLYNFSFDIS
jgi:hypothetical protein